MKKWQVVLVSKATGQEYLFEKYRWKWLAHLAARNILPERITWRYEIREVTP